IRDLIVTGVQTCALPISGAAHQLQETLAILAPLTAGEIEAAETPRDLEAWARAVSGSSALRLTLIAADGRVLADSARTPEQVLQIGRASCRERGGMEAVA